MGSGRQSKQARGRSQRVEAASSSAPGGGVTRQQTHRRRHKPTDRDFWTFLGLDLWDVDTTLSIQEIVLHWTGLYGFDLPVGQHTSNTGDEAVHLISGTYHAHDNGQRRTCGDVVTITSAVLDDHGIGLKLYMRVCEEHRAAAAGSQPFEPNETTLWLGEPYLIDGSTGWVVVHGQRDDHEPCAAPEVLALLSSAGYLIDDFGTPALPSDGEQLVRELAGLNDEDRAISQAILVMDLASVARRSTSSVFGQSVTASSRDKLDDQVEFTQHLFAKTARATLGTMRIMLLPELLAEPAELLLKRDTPKPGEVRFFPPGYDPIRYTRDPARRRLPTLSTPIPQMSEVGQQVDVHAPAFVAFIRQVLRAAHRHRLVALSTWVEAWCDQLDRAEEHGSASRVALEENAVLRRVLDIPSNRTLTEAEAVAARDRGFEDRLRKLNDVLDEGDRANATERNRTNELVTQVAALEQQLTSAHDLVDEIALDRQIAEEERIAAAESVRSMHVALQRLIGERPDLADVLAPAMGLGVRSDNESDAVVVVPPGSFKELIARLDELAPWIRFTGDPDITVGLDAQDGLGTIVTTAWESLLALADYARAKSEGACSSGIEGYLADTPPGFRGLPLRRFVPRESAGAMSQFGDERIFSVPQDVESSGQATMEAHIRLPRVGMITPRIHLLDQTRRDGDEAVYVGYIGPHLRTIGTN